MAGYQAQQFGSDIASNLDPRLAEWSENRLASLQGFPSQNHKPRPLTNNLPYGTGVHAEHPSPFQAHNSGTAANSFYGRHQQGHMFDNNEQSQSFESSPTDSSTADKTRPTTEDRLKQSTSDAVAHYEASLAVVNGVVIPSDRCGTGPSKPSNTPSDYGRPGSHYCPICGAGFSQEYGLASHFVACVGQNGNPDGVCWDDCLSVTEKTTASSPPQYAIIKVTTPISGPLYHSERKTKTNNKLNAVNGVVIPTKLAAGQPPRKCSRPTEPLTPLYLSCPLCKSLFGKRDHVKVHFPACVDRNGNPDGLRWDDGLPIFKRGPKPREPQNTA